MIHREIRRSIGPDRIDRSYGHKIPTRGPCGVHSRFVTLSIGPSPEFQTLSSQCKQSKSDPGSFLRHADPALEALGVGAQVGENPGQHLNPTNTPKPHFGNFGGEPASPKTPRVRLRMMKAYSGILVGSG